MSAKHFQLLVVKALWDEGFRNLLFARPEEAMKDFDLTKSHSIEEAETRQSWKRSASPRASVKKPTE